MFIFYKYANFVFSRITNFASESDSTRIMVFRREKAEISFAAFSIPFFVSGIKILDVSDSRCCNISKTIFLHQFASLFNFSLAPSQISIWKLTGNSSTNLILPQFARRTFIRLPTWERSSLDPSHPWAFRYLSIFMIAESS